MPLCASADIPAPPATDIFGVFAPIPESFVLSDDPFAPGAPSGPLTDSTKSQWCVGATPEFLPSVPNQMYTGFQRSPSGPTYPIYADEYDPDKSLPPPTTLGNGPPSS